jgi:hypothetical protein
VPEGASEVLGGFAPVGLPQRSAPFPEPKEIPSVAALEGFTLLTVLEGLALVEVMAEVSVILGSTPQLWCCILNFFSKQNRRTHANEVMERKFLPFEAGPRNVRLRICEPRGRDAL